VPEDAVVHPGNEVKVRLLPGEAPPPTPTPQLTHIVKSGDTAWGIALQYGLTLDELAAFNKHQSRRLSPDRAGIDDSTADTPTPEPT
jgi:LysM repeat protein